VDDVVVLVHLFEGSILVTVVASLAIGAILVIVELAAFLSLVGSISFSPLLAGLVDRKAKLLCPVGELTHRPVETVSTFKPVLTELLLVVVVVSFRLC
jgi:hypothetical protein